MVLFILPLENYFGSKDKLSYLHVRILPNITTLFKELVTRVQKNDRKDQIGEN